MGDDIPPRETNRQTAAGQHSGHPWYGGGDTCTNEYAGKEIPIDVAMPAWFAIAHAAGLGMIPYTGKCSLKNVAARSIGPPVRRCHAPDPEMNDRTAVPVCRRASLCR